MKIFPKINDIKHIAVIQTAFLGDVALTLPLAQVIKNVNNNIELSIITTPLAYNLVKCADAVDNVIIFDKRSEHKSLNGIRLFANDLKKRNIDCVISPHRSLRTTILSDMISSYSIGFDKNALSILYKKRIKYKQHIHEIERNISLLSAFVNTDDLLNNIPKPELSFNVQDKEAVELLLEQNGIGLNKFIAFAPGSVWETKRWSEDYYIELIKLFINEGYRAILIGSKEDALLCKRIAESSGADNAAGVTSIPQTLFLLGKASLTVTNDSAPTHFAGLMDCPTVSIFGPTSPIFGFAPRGINSSVAEIEGLKCRPCAIHGGRKCPIGTHECMNALKPNQVFDLCLELINRRNI